MRTLATPLVVLALLFAAAGAIAKAPSFRYVRGSVARLREAPSAEGAVVVTLRIGDEVRVLEREGGWAHVEALVDGVPRQPAAGWVKRTLLTKTRPTLKSVRERLEGAKTLQDRRRWIERATALAPFDEAIIEELIATLGEIGDERFHYMAKKGLVAAKKRNKSWDGPLYPTKAAITSIPRACVEGDPPLEEGRREDLESEALRARAFEIVDSGKVVSVTTLGYQTQLLDGRLCLAGPCGAQLGYRLPRKATDGALVPSWMVAGHVVTGYREAKARTVARALGEAPACEGCRLYLDESGRSAVQVAADGRWRLVVKTWDGARSQPWQSGALPYDKARPIARFDERPETWRLLWLAEDGREACPGEESAWLVRLGFDDEGALHQVEEGRVFRSGFLPTEQEPATAPSQEPAAP